jgi:hypothetical protein
MAGMPLGTGPDRAAVRTVRYAELFDRPIVRPDLSPDGLALEAGPSWPVCR